MTARFAAVLALCFAIGAGLGYGLFAPGPLGTLRALPFDGLRGTSADFDQPAPLQRAPQPAILAPTPDTVKPLNPRPADNYAPEDESRVG